MQGKFSIQNLIKKKPKAIIFDLHDTLVQCYGSATIEQVKADAMCTIACLNAAKMLNWLKKNKIYTAILTRCSRPFTLYCIDFCHLPEFDTLVCALDYPEIQTKPNPVSYQNVIQQLNQKFHENIQNEDTVFIGDTPVDYLCSQLCGAPFLGFAYNDKQYDRLKCMIPAENIIRDYDELISELQKLI